MNSIYSFLENDIKYQIKIIDYLYSRESQWVSIEELAEETSLQPRSVVKYILSISEVITTEYLEKMSFEMQGHHLFKIIISENKFFFDLRIEIIEKSLNITIWKKLFFFNEFNIVKFSIESFSSLSTIKRKIKKLNLEVKPFNFRITSKDDIYVVKGNETNIRLFFSLFFWNIYRGIKWPFYNVDQRKILKLVDHVTEDLRLPISYSFKNKFVYNSAVVVTRFFHNKPIIIEKNEEWNKLIEINNKLVKYLPINFTKLLKEDYMLSEDEAQHELSRMQVGQSFYQDSKMGTIAIELHKKYETDIYKASQHFLELLEKHAQVNLSDKQKKAVLISILSGHYKAFFYQEVPLLKLELDQILSNYNSLRSFVEKIYTELEDCENSFIFKQKHFLINQYMYVVSEILPLNFFEPEIAVYFDDPIDYPREILVKKMLKNFFHGTFNIKIYGPSDMLRFEKNNMDIILSAIYTEEVIFNFPNTPIIFLESGILNISKDEILLIKEALSIISKYRDDAFRLKEELKKIRKIFIIRNK